MHRKILMLLSCRKIYSKQITMWIR